MKQGRIVLFASPLAMAVSLSMPQAAYAQDAAPSSGSDPICIVDAAGQLPAGCPVRDTGRADTAGSGDIVITGTRIQLRNMTANEPTITTTRAYLENRNLTNVADALNELPVFRGSTTPNGAQGAFGAGVNFVNYFGLGSNRTLTLVNGRRFVTSNVTTNFGPSSAGVQVDLNVIPSILIDRIDTFAIGGAPVYGSDAISGGVNLILRDRFNGVEATALGGITEQGDAFRYNASLLAGRDFLDGRANITVSVSRDVQDGLFLNDRAFGRANIGNVLNPSTAQAAALGRTRAGITPANDGRLNPGIGYNDSATDGNPGIVGARDVSIYLLNRGGVITAAGGNPGAALNFQFDTNGNLVPFDRGVVFPGINASGGDGFRYNDYSQITSQVERNTGYAFAHFDVSDALKFFFEGTYYNSFAEELVEQPTFNTSLFGDTASGALTFSATNPFLNAQARGQLQALGVTSFQVSRAGNDLAGSGGSTTTDLKRFVAGARGDFQIGERRFNYEVSGNYGHNLIRNRSLDLISQNFINAINVTTNAAGQIVCTATPAVQAAPGGGRPVADPRCVPLNLLGFNRASPEARAYVTAEGTTRSRLEQTVFNANLGGSPFTLFGNDQGFNVGFEHRRERGRFDPSDTLQRALGRSAAIAPLRGGFNVSEVFGEAKLVLVTPSNNLRFLSDLEFFGSGRYVDNTVNGRFFSWSAGGRIAPVPDIAILGNYTKSFRAPAITELFLPTTFGFSSVGDPCSPAFIGGGAAPATRRRNCIAFLAAFPNATPLEALTASVPSRSGGNPDLRNEVARSFTVGVLLKPRWIPGLTARVDYLDVRIADPISSLDVGSIVTACFDNENFNLSDPANGNEFCSRIRRYTVADGGTAANGGSRAGQVFVDPANPGVSSGYVNGNRLFFSGIQGTVNYATELTGIGLPGVFAVDNTVLFVRRRQNDVTGVAPQRTDGTFGDPKFTFQSNVRYSNATWGAFGSMNFVGKQIASRIELSPDLREFNQLGSYATFNASVFFDVATQYRLTLGVTNIGNRIGAEYLGTLPPVFFADQLGRRFTAAARVRF